MARKLIRFSFPLVVACFHLMTSSAVMAQERSSPFEGNPQLVGRLKDATIRDALKLEDYQQEEIARLDAARGLIMQSMLRQLRALPQESRRGAWDAAQAQIGELDAELSKVLLPAQLSRLKQIDFQLTIRADAASAGLARKELVNALGLTPEQQKAISEDLAELEKKLNEKLAALRKEMLKAKEEARLEILKHLTDEQRKEYTRLVGDLVDRNVP